MHLAQSRGRGGPRASLTCQPRGSAPGWPQSGCRCRICCPSPRRGSAHCPARIPGSCARCLPPPSRPRPAPAGGSLQGQRCSAGLPKHPGVGGDPQTAPAGPTSGSARRGRSRGRHGRAAGRGGSSDGLVGVLGEVPTEPPGPPWCREHGLSHSLGRSLEAAQQSLSCGSCERLGCWENPESPPHGITPILSPRLGKGGEGTRGAQRTRYKETPKALPQLPAGKEPARARPGLTRAAFVTAEAKSLQGATGAGAGAHPWGHTGNVRGSTGTRGSPPLTKGPSRGAALTGGGRGPGGQCQGLRQRRIREQNAGQVLWD